MNQKRYGHFGSTYEAIFYPALLILILWLIYWADYLFAYPFSHFGVLPRTSEGLKGIIFMPLLHSDRDIFHLVNNSFPLAVLLGSLVYFYREIALRVFVISWLFTGLFLWIYAENKGSYHIGMSGVVYALLGFLFTSGVIRKFKPLQGISLFVAFVYGSLIWGIFPTKEHVSWEGHLMGLLTGVLLAFVYKNKGPQEPKYQYEIEKEMGIEPIDFEAIYVENVEAEKQRLAEVERLRKEAETPPERQVQHVIYHYVPAKKEGEDTKHPDDTVPE
jgi:membrane associated rhomboid family serine protease